MPSPGPWLDNPLRPLGPRPIPTAIKCPRCDGQGHTNRPPWVPGDQPTWASSNMASHSCPPCGGTGLLGTIAQARALLDAWCTAAEDGEALGPLRAQTLAWLGGGG